MAYQVPFATLGIFREKQLNNKKKKKNSDSRESISKRVTHDEKKLGGQTMLASCNGRGKHTCSDMIEYNSCSNDTLFSVGSG